MAKDNLTPGYAIQTVEVIPVDTSRIPPPSDQGIANLQQDILAISGKTESEKEFCRLMGGSLQVALHWLYKKKWNNSFKLPYPRKAAKAAEPLGDLFLSTFNLCEALHPHGFGAEHSNAGQWFRAVALDLMALIVEQGVHNDSAADDLKFIRGLIKDYRDEINPHDKDRDKYPHLWALVEVTLQVRRSGNLPSLIRSFWTGQRSKGAIGFIQAWTSYATFINREPGLRRIYLKNGDISARSPTNKRKDEVIFSSKKLVARSGA